MEHIEVFAAVRDGLAVSYERYARLLEGVEDTSVPVTGLDWTVRETAVHVAGGPRRYGALASGDADLSAVPADKTVLDARMRSLIADNAETDPKDLADQTRDAVAHFLAVTATLPADQPVPFYGGLRPTLVGIASALLGEPLVHGYDIATTVGVPWLIDPGYAALAVTGYRTGYRAIFQPAAAAGLDATFRLDVAGTDPFVVRIADSTYEEPADEPAVDCVITTDPVTALLLITGRLSQWPAIALGRLAFTGDRAELGPKFADLFVFP